MRKRLITGLGLIGIIFLFSGIFILHSLHNLSEADRLRDGQEKIIGQFRLVAVSVRSVQAELYRHEAGYSRNIETLVENALQIEDTIESIRSGYHAHKENSSCSGCHHLPDVMSRIESRLDRASEQLRRYEDKMSLMLTIDDPEIERGIEKDAEEEAGSLLPLVDEGLRAAVAMSYQMDGLQDADVRRAKSSVIIAIVLSSLLSLVVVVSLIKAVRTPLLSLVNGIERVAAGHYGSKVEVFSNDEIGFLARTFNEMSENLEAVRLEKNGLLEELQRLNMGLEVRVREAAEELRLTHEQVLRSETLSALGTFASGVAHELATPISSVIGYLQVIKERPAGGEHGEFELIEKELVRCRNILRGMLAFARSPEKEKMLVNINGILHDLITLISYQAKYKHVQINEDLETSLPSIMAVPGQFRQVFMNIIVNALEAMPQGGKLDVGTRLTSGGQRLEVSIADTGCGMPKEEVKKIFQPFYTGKVAGTGLGLSITYGIVKGHGGDIEVKSEEGKGTTFIISLPVAAEHVKLA